MDDMIRRQTILDALDEISHEVADGYGFDYAKWREYFCELPSVKLATDTNVGTKLGTDLAQLGTDLISRQAAIEAIRDMQAFEDDNGRSYLYLDEVMAVFTDEEELPPAEPEKRTDKRTETNGVCLDAISRQDALDICDNAIDLLKGQFGAGALDAIRESIAELPPAEEEQQHGRIFQEIVAEYPSISTYLEYKGKPYFSIKYTENGQEFIGYGTYSPEVLSEYLKEYFMPPAEPKRGKWILDRSGAYCCSECMEPCAGYVMMKPRDKFCKMCGSRNEVTE